MVSQNKLQNVILYNLNGKRHTHIFLFFVNTNNHKHVTQKIKFHKPLQLRCPAPKSTVSIWNVMGIIAPGAMVNIFSFTQIILIILFNFCTHKELMLLHDAIIICQNIILWIPFCIKVECLHHFPLEFVLYLINSKGNPKVMVKSVAILELSMHNIFKLVLRWHFI